jgi:hypothetical protein
MIEYQLGPDERFVDIYEPRTKSYDALHSHRLVDRVMCEMESLLKDLEDYHPMMPKVDDGGTSECPFAEEIDREKQKREKKVSEKANTLRDMKAELDREVERCKRNLQRISVDASKISTGAAQEKYAEGLGRQEREYVEASRLKDEVVELLHRVDATLAASRKKSFPLPLEEQMPSSGMKMSASSYPDDNDNHELTQEVNDLLSMGPRGRN